ncbi:restriction endonuclease subunit S [Kribbella qitaiheensis]|uniref:restriction endonuclease subunit S n=1 Tax=Kribbella qitaiheensis TaxID=1544730 RepID=UPI00361E3649
MNTAWSVLEPSVDLPRAWGVARIGDIADLVNGYPFASESFAPAGDIPLIRIRDLLTDQFETYVSGRVPPHSLLRDGDLVIGMDGDFNLALWNRGPAALNQRLCLLRPRLGTDIRFVAYALPMLLSIVNDLTFSTTVKHLSSGQVLAERIPWPPLEEQRRIADFLDAETARIDKLLNHRSRVRALLVLKRGRVIEEQLGLNSVDTRLVPLKYLVDDVSVGIVITPAAWYVDEGGIPALRGINVKPGRIVQDDIVRISEEGHAFHHKSRLRAGDLVVVRTGQAGVAAVVPPEFAGANCIDLVIVRPAVDLLPRYAEYVLNSSYAQRRIGEYSVGTIQSHFNVSAMKQMPIPVISYHEQKRRVDAVDLQVESMDSLSESYLRQERLLSERRQALITAAVTGQIDVTTARGVDVS